MLSDQPSVVPRDELIVTQSACERLARRLDTSHAVVWLAAEAVGRNSIDIEAFLRAGSSSKPLRQVSGGISGLG